MLKTCLAFWESEPQYAYKRYAYKNVHLLVSLLVALLFGPKVYLFGSIVITLIYQLVSGVYLNGCSLVF